LQLLTLIRTNGESNQAIWLGLLGIIIINFSVNKTQAMIKPMLSLIQLGAQRSPLCDFNGLKMLAEAGVLRSPFATEQESEKWSGLCCFMPHLTHLTVYCDNTLDHVKGRVTFSLQCSVNDTNGTPIPTTITVRLDHNGLSSETHTSKYGTTLSNVGYATYYVTRYGESEKNSLQIVMFGLLSVQAKNRN